MFHLEMYSDLYYKKTWIFHLLDGRQIIAKVSNRFIDNSGSIVWLALAAEDYSGSRSELILSSELIHIPATAISFVQEKK